jgi:hypothetical protein
MRRLLLVLALILAAATAATPAGGPTLGGRHEIAHAGKAHESHLSAPAVTVRRDGTALVAWFAQQGHDNHLFVVQAGASNPPTRVNPDGLTVESLHQAPGLALGPNDEIYLTWSSPKPVPPGGYFASDLRLSRSLDGGRAFEAPLRVNEDRPISHSFEGFTVAADGTILLAWIDSREGPTAPRTWFARVVERGTRVERVTRLDDAETCVCCRIDVASAGTTVAVFWRKVFPGSLRDMVLDVSRDRGHSFGAPALVHADRWKIAACPHRGGSIAMDAGGRAYLAWYTEGTDDQPRMLFATSADGQRFGAPTRLDSATGSVPDHVRVAATGDGRVAIVWEEATAVRRRIVFRASVDAGRTLGAPQVLSQAIKAYAPDIAAAPNGEFVVAWHEEQFPSIKTIVQTIEIPK